MFRSGMIFTLLAQVIGLLSFFSTLHNFTSTPPRRNTSTVATTSVSSEPLATNTKAFLLAFLIETYIHEYHITQPLSSCFLFFNTQDYSFCTTRDTQTHKQKKKNRKKKKYKLS